MRSFHAELQWSSSLGLHANDFGLISGVEGGKPVLSTIKVSSRVILC